MRLLKTQSKIYSIVLCLLLAMQGMAQDPGGNPDGPPPAVPFDDYMNLIMAGIGVVFMIYVFKRKQALKHSV